jgi:osmoprotectant transport system permease protein
MGGLPFFEYLVAFRDDLLFQTQQHALLSVQVVIVASLLAVLLGMGTYRSNAVSNTAIGTSAVMFTLPSIALFGLLVPIFGFSLASVFPVLVLYALLPVLRNTVAGLRSVDENMLDAARGMGMGRLRILTRIEVPLAWPVILTGIRVSAQLTVGLVVISAYILGPGLGNTLLGALSNLGSANTFNQALAGTILTILLALVLDLAFVFIRRLTIPRGLRV